MESEGKERQSIKMEGGESFLDPHSTLTRLIYSLIHTCISFIFPLSFQYFLNRQAFLRFPLSPLSLLLPLFTLANCFSLSLSISFSPSSLLLILSLSISFSLLSRRFSFLCHSPNFSSSLQRFPKHIPGVAVCKFYSVLFPSPCLPLCIHFSPLFCVLSLFDSSNHKVLFGVCFLNKKFSFSTQTLNDRSSN